MSNKIIIPLIFLIFVIIGVNAFPLLSDPLYSIKTQLISPSFGTRYQGYLSLYRHYLVNNNLIMARTIENKLDPGDLEIFQANYYPERITRQINELVYKNNKTSEDWVKIAKYQARIGLFSEAQTALKNASLSDPIRDDLEQLYLQF